MKSKVALRTLLCFGLWLILQNFNAFAQLQAQPTVHSEGKGSYKIRKLVLDAGHGGKDPGCLGANSKEKDNALAIILKLGALIEQEYPDIKVIYTRSTDVFVELKERAAIANRNDADLFISVHCNSISTSRVHGTETYVMGLHTAQHNLEVAKRENSSIYLEDNYQKNYEGYDPESPEAHIMGSVWQSTYLEQSILFASMVQQSAHLNAEREDKGVKQAGFLVLRETAMPSVLIESGYLTNLEEENFIASEEGRDQMALSIFEAFKSYKNQLESGAKSSPQQLAKSNTTKPKAPVKTINTAPKTGSSTASTKSNPTSAKTGTTTIQKPIAQPVALKTEMVYRIVLLSWPSRMDRNAGQLALLTNVREEQKGGKYIYFVGDYVSRAEAEKVLPELRNMGFKTATIEAVTKTKS